MQISLATHPESYSSLLVRSLTLYRAGFTHIFGLALLLSFIIFIPRILSLMIGKDIFFTVSLNTIYNIFLIFLTICISFVFTAILWRLRCIITNAHETIFDDFLIASKKILFIIAAAMIQVLIISGITLVLYYFLYVLKNHTVFNSNLAIVLSILYFMMAVYIFYLLIFYLPLILTEDQGILSALKKSAVLVWGNWWRVFSLQITPLVIYLFCLLLLKYLFGVDFNLYFSYSRETSIIISLSNLLILAFFVPLNATVLLTQLRDLELRKQEVSSFFK